MRSTTTTVWLLAASSMMLLQCCHLLSLPNVSLAFVTLYSPKTSSSIQRSFPPPPFRLETSWKLANDNENAADDGGIETSQNILPPREDNDDLMMEISSLGQSEVSTAVMISQNQKRILIEELGYKRYEVEEMRVELAGPIIAKRQRCPQGGMPPDWYRSEEESAMMKKLQSESKYPFKIPLLGISLILFGKGLGDALITIIKVNIDFPGASLTEEFMGVPVLAIDAVCVIAGALLGSWTWKTMRD